MNAQTTLLVEVYFWHGVVRRTTRMTSQMLKPMPERNLCSPVMLELAPRANVSFSESGEVLLLNFQPRSQGFSLIVSWKPGASSRLSHKLLGNFSATFYNFGNF